MTDEKTKKTIPISGQVARYWITSSIIRQGSYDPIAGKTTALSNDEALKWIDNTLETIEFDPLVLLRFSDLKDYVTSGNHEQDIQAAG